MGVGTCWLARGGFGVCLILRYGIMVFGFMIGFVVNVAVLGFVDVVCWRGGLLVACAAYGFRGLV